MWCRIEGELAFCPSEIGNESLRHFSLMPRDQTPDLSTPSERYLANLCKQSFLSLWSWPHLYRNQGWGSGDEGKEICDLLVVFPPDVLIFSDKYVAFGRGADLSLAWSRWFRKAVLQGARQVLGAERWLRQFPNRVFIDRSCRERLPIQLPSPSEMQIHRLVVAHGASARCRQIFGGSGSLMIDSSLLGENHYDPAAGALRPFVVGHVVDPSRFIHVMDDTTLDVLLKTLDTVPDFVNYLRKKEKLFRGKMKIAAAGEEELLALYLRDMNDEGEHDFELPKKGNATLVAEGFWEGFCKHPDRVIQVQANRISYAWDELIEKFAGHAIDRTLVDQAGDDGQVELALRFLARESRTRRRMLAKDLRAVLMRGDETFRAARIVSPSNPGDPHYVILALAPIEGMSREDYRRSRRNLLEAYCRVAKIEFPDAKDIVGIATEPASFTPRSEDLAYLDTRQWSESDDEHARQIQAEWKLLVEKKAFASAEDEYPRETIRLAQKGRSRNRPCHCGSGRKYKKCHGGERSDSSE
jgi:hypothetical protein